MDLHAEIRRIAKTRHIAPALASHRSEFSISVRDLMTEAEAEGISTTQRVPAFCKSIQTSRFLKEHGLTISKIEGPKSGQSTTVVIHYKVADAGRQFPEATTVETSEERASRLTERIRGLMKDKIAEHGGAAGYIRWVRSDEGDE